MSDHVEICAVCSKPVDPHPYRHPIVRARFHPEGATVVESARPHAKLPPEPREHPIGDLKLGDSGYIVTWALSADRDDLLWIDPRHTVSRVHGGTARVGLHMGPLGYRVTMPEAQIERVRRGAIPSWYLPVAELIIPGREGGGATGWLTTPTGA